MSPPTVVLVGTLDTKGTEYAFLRERLEQAGVATLLVDVGTQGPPRTPADVPREEVAAAGGFDLAAADRPRYGRAGDVRGRAGASSAGCSTRGAARASSPRAGRAAPRSRPPPCGRCPWACPSSIVSTMASGDTQRLRRRQRRHADARGHRRRRAQLGLRADPGQRRRRHGGHGRRRRAGRTSGESRPVVAATMFGVTTPAVTAAREELERRGYEVLVFHATGTGGRSMEGLVEAGLRHRRPRPDDDGTRRRTGRRGAVGRSAPAGGGRPARRAAGRLARARSTWSTSGPRETVPERFAGPQPLRAQPDRHADADDARGVRGARPAGRAPSCRPRPGRSRCSCRCAGVSAISGEGGPFFDPDADAALLAGLRETLGPVGRGARGRRARQRPRLRRRHGGAARRVRSGGEGRR